MKRFLSKFKRKKVIIVASILSGFFGLVLFGVFGFIIWASVCIYSPVNSYERVYNEPWASLNADMMLFESESDFMTSHQQLDAVPLQSEDRIVAEFLMGKADGYLGNLDEAESHYQWVTALKQSNNWIANNNNVYFMDESFAALSKIYYLQGKPKLALQMIEQIQYPEDLEDAYFNEALANMLSNPQRGDMRYKLSQELKHNLYLAEARQEMTLAKGLTHDPDLSLTIANELQTEMPVVEHDGLTPMGRYLNLAGNYYKNNLERPSTAIQFFEKALVETPEFEWTHQQLALSYYDDKKPEKAVKHSHKAIALNEQFYLPYLTLGDEALDAENYTEALEHFSKAKAIVSSFTDSKHQIVMNNIETQLGFTYEALEEPHKALSHYQYVVKHSSRDSVDYQYALKAIQRL